MFTWRWCSALNRAKRPNTRCSWQRNALAICVNSSINYIRDRLYGCMVHTHHKDFVTKSCLLFFLFILFMNYMIRSLLFDDGIKQLGTIIIRLPNLKNWRAKKWNLRLRIVSIANVCNNGTFILCKGCYIDWPRSPIYGWNCLYKQIWHIFH